MQYLPLSMESVCCFADDVVDPPPKNPLTLQSKLCRSHSRRKSLAWKQEQREATSLCGCRFVCLSLNTKDMDESAQPGSTTFIFLQYRFPDGGLILRASGIYGDRDVGAVTVPLGAVMRPMEMVRTKLFCLV